MSDLEDILRDIEINDMEGFSEPDWLKEYTVWQDGEFLYVSHIHCNEEGTCTFTEGTTLYAMKLWAYYHLEECGK